jgi:hypothetical protein
MSDIEPGARIIYRPLPTRSPATLRLDGHHGVVVRVAEDDSGRAMVLFPDLSLIAAIPDEMAITA